MAGEIPDVYAKFIADTTAFVANVLKGVESVAELTKNLYQADFASALLQGNLDAAAAAATAATEAARALADVQARLADAEKLAADSAAAEEQASAALFDVLAGMADAERAAAEGAVALADAEKAAADASRLAAEGMRVAGDAELAAGAKAKESAGMMGFLTGAVEKSGAAMQAMASHAKLAFEVLGGAIGVSVYEAAKFDGAMTRLVTQAHVSTDQIGALRQGVLQLAGQVGFSPNNLADSLYHVESNFAGMGLSAQKALDLVRVAAEGARVGNANLVDTTNALTAAVAANIPGVQNLDQAMGALNATVGAGDMQMQDLNKAFGSGMVAVVKGYGLSIRDVGAALAVLGDNNIRGAVAGTQFRMAIQAFAKPAASAKDELQKLNMTQDQLAKDMQTGGLMKAVMDLKKHMDDAGVSAKEQGQVITDLFGKKAGSGINVLMNNVDKLKSKYGEIDKAANGFGKSWDQTQKTASQGFADLENSVKALAVEFGTAMLPALNAVGTELTTAFNNPTTQKALQDFGKFLGEVFKAAEPLVPVVMNLADQLMTALGPALPPLAKALAEFSKALGDQLGKVILAIGPQLPILAKAMGQMLLALLPLLPPLAKLLVELAPLIEVAARVAVEFAYMGQSFAMAVAWVINLVDYAVKWVVTAIQAFTKNTYDAFKWLYDELIGHSIIPDLINGMIGWFTKGVDTVRQILSWFEGLPGDFQRWMQGMVDAVSRGFSQVIGLSQSLPGRILGALGSLGSLLYNAGQSVIQGLISGIQSMLGNLYSIVGGIAGAISNLKGPIDKDRVLLHPHGQALMAGLQAGIEQGLVDVYGTVSQVAEEVAAQVASPHHHHHAAHGHGHGHHHPAHHPAAHHPHLHRNPFGPEPAGIGYTSGVGALAYGAGGQVIHNYTIIQVQGSVISDRDLDRIVRKNSTQRSLWNSTSGLTVPSGRTG